MKKIHIAGGVLAVVVVVVLYSLGVFTVATPGTGVTPDVSDPKNTTYTIEGLPVTLVSGRAETIAAPGSATTIVTEYIGNEVVYDFNVDGRMDTAFTLAQSPGGSGTFYYEVVALNLPEGYVGSAGVLIGDRIALQSARIIADNGKEGVIEVNYADRLPDESYTTEPSVGKTMLFKFDVSAMQLGVVEAHFEGEANPDMLSLKDKTWGWVRTDYTDGRVFAPKKDDAFSLTFTEEGKVSAKTDCNGMSGAYTAVSDSLVFGPLMMTKMYCEGSEEGVFGESLGQVSTYRFTSKGELELVLKADTGTMIFR